MTPLTFSHYTLVSAVGRGLPATRQALLGMQSGLRPCDLPGVELDTWIGRVEGLEAGECAIATDYECRNNRLAALALRQDGFTEAVLTARSRYGAHRVAVILGTSTSGIAETERAYAQRYADDSLPTDYLRRYRYTHNTYALADFVRKTLGLHGPAFVISTACSSSAKVFASASRLFAADLCDAAVVGGVDSLCLTTLYGFSALQLTSTQPCRPCDAERDGLSLGEAGAFILLERPIATSVHNVTLLGYGETNDGYHMSHPHPEGRGAIGSMRAALDCAGLAPGDIDYVNLHGTATPANDRIEDLAVHAVFGSGTRCSSTKGWTGHTLGAAGATACVIAALCLETGLLPGTANTHRLDPKLRSHILLTNQTETMASVMINIFGFGGNNCSLVVGKR
jgi:3-oxoacyl-[acyl-carrier-protein] synthase I